MDEILEKLQKRFPELAKSPDKEELWIYDANPFLIKYIYTGEFDFFSSEPTELNSSIDVATFNDYALCLMRYKQFVEILEKQLNESLLHFTEEEAIDDFANHKKPGRKKSLTPEQERKLLDDYKLFTQGKRKWVHKEEAEKYGISVTTLKKTLGGMRNTVLHHPGSIPSKH